MKEVNDQKDKTIGQHLLGKTLINTEGYNDVVAVRKSDLQGMLDTGYTVISQNDDEDLALVGKKTVEEAGS